MPDGCSYVFSPLRKKGACAFALNRSASGDCLVFANDDAAAMPRVVPAARRKFLLLILFCSASSPIIGNCTLSLLNKSRKVDRPHPPQHHPLLLLHQPLHSITNCALCSETDAAILSKSSGGIRVPSSNSRSDSASMSLLLSA